MHPFFHLFTDKQSGSLPSSLVGLLLVSNALATLTRLWDALRPKIRPLRTSLALVASAIFFSFPSRGQTFKAVPLDCGGSGFAQAENGRLYGYGDVFGAWCSDNGGTTWNYLNWSIPDGGIYGTGMAVQKNNADIVYCTSDALQKSTNGGATWSLLEVGDYYTPRFRGASPILIRSNNPNEIWFAGPRKNLTGWLWKSSNGGPDWVKAGGSNFDSNRARTLHNVAAFAFANQIWVGSDNGL
ncbi:exo-alpha-sialidase [Hymenobacter sp. BT664]|uniref:Exo-alpha-sialidase n=1 Tax=Hymenobacter montanus TaxID=2771359 RepID=A0A927GJ39_9BACT|nr:sialidase family protein [Hymenobacter montanus]MBD2768010.1 exo-alpha-sialidase [Hymenobacter montanus]